MASLFLHRTSVVRVNLFVAATTHGPHRPGSTSMYKCFTAEEGLMPKGGGLPDSMCASSAQHGVHSKSSLIY